MEAISQAWRIAIGTATVKYMIGNPEDNPVDAEEVVADRVELKKEDDEKRAEAEAVEANEGSPQVT